jgi:hypothetical protein
LHTDVDAEALLTLWEAALEQPAAARGDALLAAAAPAAASPRTLGERNARLLVLHERLFGPEIELLSHCPACGVATELAAECGALMAAMPDASTATLATLESDGYRVELRSPTSADVAAAASAHDAEEFALRVLDRCVLSCARDGSAWPVRELPAVVLDGISRRLELLDPGASVSFTVACPQCDARWNAPLDVGDLVWRKVQQVAERVLLDVDALAREYGWTEVEVLRMSATRRAAYLQLVSA